MARDISKLHPEVQKKVTELLTICASRGLIIGISDCVRTKKEQDALYAKGRTTSGKRVTNAVYPQSNHCWGIALDFFLKMDIDGDGKTYDDAFNDSTGKFKEVAEIAKSLGFAWGGGWKTLKDKPHIEYLGFGDWKQLQAKYGTPANFFKSWTATPVVVAVTKKVVVAPKGDAWVRALQSAIGAKVDGIAGDETLGKCPVLRKGSKGTVVNLLQNKFNSMGIGVGKADGIGGDKFKAGIMEFQKRNGLKIDGVFGEKSWKKMLGL